MEVKSAAKLLASSLEGDNVPALTVVRAKEILAREIQQRRQTTIKILKKLDVPDEHIRCLESTHFQ